MVSTRSGRKTRPPPQSAAPQSQPSSTTSTTCGGGATAAISKKLSGLRGRLYSGSSSKGSKGSLSSKEKADDATERDDGDDFDLDPLPELTLGASRESSTSSGGSASSSLPRVTVVSETDGSSHTASSCGGDMDEDTSMCCSSDGGTAALHWKFYEDGDDSYADVRERMERLSRDDRAEHVFHQHCDHSAEAGEVEDGLAEASHGRGKCRHVVDESTIPFFAAVTTYLGYAVLIFVGHLRDICARIFRSGRYLRNTQKSEFPSDDLRLYAPLLKSWENFYTRRLYHRIQDCFNRPISSRPGAVIDVLERVSTDGNKTMHVLGRGTQEQRDEYAPGEHFVEVDDDKNAPAGSGDGSRRVARRCLNLGSYNYLGFADDWDQTCRTGVVGSLTALPVSSGSSRLEFGTTSLHDDVERLVAEFTGKEAAVVLNMGFNTNATVIPALANTKGDLLVSDELNHTSIVNGARASGASIRTFRHNDAAHLEEILRTAIVMGRPRTRRPWNRILVVVEGIYSMEGEYCDLPSIVRVCKKYGAYVYLDEAHSIGAMGPTGRGCCEYTGVDPADVDVMMGTFTKSFGGMGGYIAGSREVVDYLRERCAGSSYHNSLSPVVCQQIISSFEVIMGRDGTSTGRRKLNSLRDNSNYFRMRLTDMGLHVLGNYDSPIMPVMLYNPTKIAAFSRECLKRGLAVVVVGFPAVPVLMSRARFCISAGHARDELDGALREIEEIADLLKLRYARSTFG